MQRSGGFQLIGPAQAWQISLHLWRGELDAAARRVADGLDRVAKAEPDLIYNAELYWLAVRVQADLVVDGGLDSGQRDGAEARGSAALGDLDEVIAGIPGEGAPPEALALRALAYAELTRLRGEHAPAPWRIAGERFHRLGEVYRVAYTQYRGAEALALVGAGDEEVREPLVAAHATAVALGTRPFQEEVEALARRGGISLGRHARVSERANIRVEPPIEDVLELLTGSRRGPRPSRLLATIMFTDIVGSTALAADLGDRRWRELLDRHDELVRAQLKQFGGVAIKFIGDGTLTTFDSPGRAISCACALRDGATTLGVKIRAGVHAGEIELRGDDIGGIAVHIGARVAALAEPSEILVSQTVIDVVAGSEIQFEDRGTHTLKGVPGTWHLNAVAAASARVAESPD